MESSKTEIGISQKWSIAEAVKRQPLAAVGVVLLIVFTICAVFAPFDRVAGPRDPQGAGGLQAPHT